MLKSASVRIFLSAAEPSADRHCAGLIKAIRQLNSNIEFAGIGGPKMAEAGCSLLNEPQAAAGHSAMELNAFAHILYYHRLIRQAGRFFANNKVDLVIVCDSPAFNFHIAKAAKKRGIKTLFYVAPQLWAWAPWRISKLKKFCDKLCCILPFEQDWFTSRGVPAEFVGNPMLDDITQADLKKAKRDYRNFNKTNVKIALVPGSRPAEVGSLWRPMQQIAVNLRKQYPAATFTTVAVDHATKGALDSTRLMNFRPNYAIDAVYQTALDSDFALVASGSATLQVAAAGCPMAIMYQSSPLLWHLLGRWLITTKYLSLVNILAERQQRTDNGTSVIGHPSSVIRLSVVLEFMPYFRKPHLNQISADLLTLVQPLISKKAGPTVARLAIALLA
ncbi:MAG: lipid-A-disaccharide synthase [Sedimentisphaerales bacterium]